MISRFCAPICAIAFLVIRLSLSTRARHGLNLSSYITVFLYYLFNFFCFTISSSSPLIFLCVSVTSSFASSTSYFCHSICFSYKSYCRCALFFSSCMARSACCCCYLSCCANSFLSFSSCILRLLSSI